MSSSSGTGPTKKSTEDLLREGKLSGGAAQMAMDTRELLGFRNPIPRILQAAAFAADKHRLQTRKDKDATPYINHPLALASLLAYECAEQDETLLIAALLHDTIEDTQTTFAEIASRFGTDVAEIVRKSPTTNPWRRKSASACRSRTPVRRAELRSSSNSQTRSVT
jgi:(p)ppGpp synthase/HD superfamily hydrolase